MTQTQQKHTSSRILISTALAALVSLPIGVAPTQPVSASTQVCSPNSPFGKVLRLGRENEIFINAVDTFAGPRVPSIMRLDVTTDTLLLAERGFVADTGNNRDNISPLVAATTADLNGDGAEEVIQSFTDAGNQYQVVVHENGQPLRHRNLNLPGHAQHAIGAGDVLSRNNATEQIVVAARSASGVLSVNVVEYNAATGVGASVASWSSSLVTRTNATDIFVSVGNFDDDGYHDILITAIVTNGGVRNAHLIHLEFEEGFTSSGTNTAIGLRERASTVYFVARATEQYVARAVMASMTGSTRQDVFLTYATADAFQVTLGPIYVKRFEVGLVNGTLRFLPREQLVIPSSLRSLDMEAGDLNGDFKDELVLAYDQDGNNSSGTLNVAAVRLVGADTPTPQFEVLSTWSDGQNGRQNSTRVDLDVGDVDKDNRSEIVVGFRDSSPLGMQVILLNPIVNQSGALNGFSLQSAERFDPTLTHPMSIHLADWDKDSRLAVASAVCREVTERIITSASFVPPFWRNIQGDQEHSGFIGSSTSQGSSVEKSLSYNRSNSVSSYLGVEVGASFFDLVEFSAAAKATSSREYATSSSETTNVATAVVRTVSRSWGNSAVVYEQANYRCYTYTLFDAGQALSGEDAALRMCEYVRPTGAAQLSAAVLDSWDSASGRKPEYAAVARDWASLSLFRGPFTAQSSVSGTLSAANALDNGLLPNSESFVSGPASQTQVEQNPWWQVDLGNDPQPIGKVRLWVPPASLSQVYVLISNNDFRLMPNANDPAALATQPGVFSYTLASLGNGLVFSSVVGGPLTWQTVDSAGQPRRGRFVRVQRADNAALSLSEVQVFGGNHVDPDRHPLDVRDTVKGDGLHEVLVFNPFAPQNTPEYVWVNVRGNLIWSVPASANEPLRGLNATWGGATTSWSMGSQSDTSRLKGNSVSSSTSIGVEVETEGGVGVKVLAGTGVQQTVGFENSTVVGVSWGNAFDIGGAVEGFPSMYSQAPTIDWAEKCGYGFVPYYYEVSEQANLGYVHRFPVLDYLVPYINTQSSNRKTDTLDYCRNGNPPASQAQAVNDAAPSFAGRSNLINPLANDSGNGLTLAGVGNASNGTTQLEGGALASTRSARSANDTQARTIRYVPNAGFVGTDSFTYTARSESGEIVNGVVTVTVRLAPAAHLPMVRR
jgi:hypothetical protein